MSCLLSTVSPLVIDNVPGMVWPLARLLSPLRSTPLRLKHVILICWLATMSMPSVHVERSSVRLSAAAPAHTPLPAPGDDGEELLLLDELSHGHKLAMVGVTLEQSPVANGSISGAQYLRLVLTQ